MLEKKCNWHYVKIVQMRSFFRFVFSRIWTEYGKKRTRKNSVFGHFSRSATDLWLTRAGKTRYNENMNIIVIFLDKIWTYFNQTNNSKQRGIAVRSFIQEEVVGRTLYTTFTQKNTCYQWLVYILLTAYFTLVLFLYVFAQFSFILSCVYKLILREFTRHMTQICVDECTA